MYYKHYSLTTLLTWALGREIRLNNKSEIFHEAGYRWLLPTILAAQEAEIRRTEVQSQPRQIVLKTLSQKNPSQKRAGGVAQGLGPEFKPQYHQKKKRNS
jgi:hypothetical protein